ncbi:hypothetical protein C2E23DRAFT_883373 [Lenzites betulinus]|nr:hypothetical protein C2E23DRAFT_883373 [Lenzites betulinus]
MSFRYCTPDSEDEHPSSLLGIEDDTADDYKRAEPVKKVERTVQKVERSPKFLATKTRVSRSPAFRIEPIRSTPSPSSSKKPITAASTTRITRSASKPSLSSITPVSGVSVEAQAEAIQLKPLHYTRQTKPHTAWFASESDDPIACPPTMDNQYDVRVGDVFCHKTPEMSQLWLWVSDGSGWSAVRIGHVRADGRCLSITDVKGEPSWVGSDWFGKRLTAMKKKGRI